MYYIYIILYIYISIISSSNVLQLNVTRCIKNRATHIIDCRKNIFMIIRQHFISVFTLNILKHRQLAFFFYSKRTVGTTALTEEFRSLA